MYAADLFLLVNSCVFFFFFSSRRRHTRFDCDWSSDVCSSDLPNEASALTFSDFLYVQGIHNQVEHENDGWGIWIHSEDELDKAKDMLKHYVGNPNDPRFHKHSRRANELKEQQHKEDQAAKEKTFDRTTLFKSTMPYGVGHLTVLLMAASIGVSGLALTNQDSGLFELLMISNYKPGLREVQ